MNKRRFLFLSRWFLRNKKKEKRRVNEDEMRCELIVSICNACVYVKFILSFFSVIHSVLGIFPRRYRSITFFSFLSFFSSQFSFSSFDILMTGRVMCDAKMLNVYIYMRSNTFLSVCLLPLFHFSLYNY